MYLIFYFKNVSFLILNYYNLELFCPYTSQECIYSHFSILSGWNSVKNRIIKGLRLNRIQKNKLFENESFLGHLNPKKNKCSEYYKGPKLPDKLLMKTWQNREMTVLMELFSKFFKGKNDESSMLLFLWHVLYVWEH